MNFKMTRDATASCLHFEILDKMFSYNFILGYQVIKITTIMIVFDTHTIWIFVWITQKLFQKSGI